jgi:hypothetical protein
MCTFVHKVKTDEPVPKTPTKTCQKPQQKPAKNPFERSEIGAKNLSERSELRQKPPPKIFYAIVTPKTSSAAFTFVNSTP